MSFIPNLKNILQKKPALNSGSCFRDCSEMPLYNWVKLCISGDLQWIVKEGSPDNIETHYEALYNEFLTINKDPSTDYIFNIRKELHTLNAEIFIIESIVSFLRNTRNEELINILKNPPFNFRLAYKDLDKDLDRTLSLAKARIGKLKLKESQYLELQKKESGKATTEADWYENIQYVGQWLGYQINTKKTSVLEYVVNLNSFKEASKKQINK